MNFLQTGYKGKNDSWMYVIMFFIVFIGSMIGQIPITVKAFFAADGDLQKFAKSGENSFADLGIDANLYLFLILLSFIVPLALFLLTVRGMHKKKITWIVTSRKKIDWGRFFFGFGLIAALSIVTTVLDFYSNPENYVVQFELIPFLIMLVIVITLIPIQTSFEEYFFRGYLMQGIGIAAKNKWVPLLITSVIFGGLHFFNPEVEKIGNIAMVYYIGTGFFLGIITLMDEGMEISLGFHAGTNLIIALLVTSDWTVFQTNSILLDLSDPGAGIEVVLPVFILYPILLAIMAWKYKWTHWREKLFGKISPPDTLGALKE